jgi:hypothetical protein
MGVDAHVAPRELYEGIPANFSPHLQLTDLSYQKNQIPHLH